MSGGGVVTGLLLLLQEGGEDSGILSGLLGSGLFGGVDVMGLVRASLWVVLGLPILFSLTRGIRSWVSKKYSLQQGLIAGKFVFYPGLLLIFITTLGELGFSLTPLLGAAGIAGIAIGFASQTSVSNVISGFFLIAERPFQVDDVIQVGGTTGRVLSIDTLSVKLRTFDNRFIRIPNETIVKSEVTTITRFPIRRLDLNVGVAYKEDIPRVRDILVELAGRNPRALMEPAPMVFFDGYGDSSLDLRLTVWTTRENFWGLKNSMLEEIKAHFDEVGIEIPFPHRTLYTGEVTDPFPIRLVGDPAVEDPRDARDPASHEGRDDASDEQPPRNP
jgi:small-conductance mechanosensitive channel